MSLDASNIVVVGGGIVGASIAWHLAPSANVTVVAEDLGGVATPKSFAWINAASGNPKFYYDFRHRSMQRWVEMSEELPDLQITWSGSLNWNMPEDELEAYLENHTAWGYDLVRVNQTQASEMEPKLEEDGIPDLGLLAKEEGAMEAEVVAVQLIEHAKTMGASVVESTVTRFLKEESGKVRGVVTPEGEIPADHVVLAAGLGSVPLLAAEGVRLPLERREGMLINSRPTEIKFLNTLYNGDALHMRQTLDGRIRSGADFSGGDTGEDPQEATDELFAKVKGAFKGGEELEFDYYTIGVRPDPEDGYPILGPTGVEGLTVAVMHSGVTNAAVVGELLAKQILTNVSDPLLAPFRLDRFEGKPPACGEGRSVN